MSRGANIPASLLALQHRQVGYLFSTQHHELRNLLTALRLAEDVLEPGVPLSSLREIPGDRLREPMTALRALLGFLLDLANPRMLQPVLADLGTTVDWIVAALGPSTSRLRIQLQRVQDSAPLMMLADRMQLARGLGCYLMHLASLSAPGTTIEVRVRGLAKDEAQVRYPGYAGEVARLEVHSDQPPGDDDGGAGPGQVVASAELARSSVTSAAFIHAGVAGLGKGAAAPRCWLELPLGVRAPCWERPDAPTESCVSCEVRAQGLGFMCWGAPELCQLGTAEHCQAERCSTFRTYHLSAHTGGSTQGGPCPAAS